jgi:hypothetical protein
MCLLAATVPISILCHMELFSLLQKEDIKLTGNGPVRRWWSGGARMRRLVRALDIYIQ